MGNTLDCVAFRRDVNAPLCRCDVVVEELTGLDCVGKIDARCSASMYTNTIVIVNTDGFAKGAPIGVSIIAINRFFRCAPKIKLTFDVRKR